MSLPESEVRAGLALQPQSLDVSLVDRPLTDLLFTQFMASVSGKVFCLGNAAVHSRGGLAPLHLSLLNSPLVLRFHLQRPRTSCR